MRMSKNFLFVLAIASAGATAPVLADEFDQVSLARPADKGPGQQDSGSDPGNYGASYQDWMHVDVKAAWAWEDGYYGQGVTITVVDDHKSIWGFSGNLDGGDQEEVNNHGGWTLLEASMIAPGATMVADHWGGRDREVKLSSGLNVLNLSYGMIAQSGYDLNQISWGRQESSIISYATNGTAVISKAAGNDYRTAVGESYEGTTDYLNLALIGAPSAIFVGALSTNGSTAFKASLADYSNIAGTNEQVQDHFLVVGVDSAKMGGLAGTSFAAPIVSGYAAIVGSKFTDQTATWVANRLLTTARIDTIADYSPSVYGRGEADLPRALAANSIE
jgi:subtilisin family serine protease